MKNFRPFYFLACLVLIVGLACNLSSGGGSQPEQPQQPQQQDSPQNTEAPVNEEPTAVPQPTDTPEPAATALSNFFTEEFDVDPVWNYFLTFGDESKANVEFSNSRMIFTLDDLNIYAYYIFEGAEYDNVKVEIRAENRGRNNNNVSLVCRASEDGWYEFSTEGGGVWYLYAVAPGDDGKLRYNVIDNGGAKSLKQGKETNEYSMTCVDNEIRLAINGVDVKTVRETNFSFRSGFVGFNISSLNVVPIIVEVDWYRISEP